jgi:hypothetical protein
VLVEDLLDALPVLLYQVGHGLDSRCWTAVLQCILPWFPSQLPPPMFTWLLEDVLDALPVLHQVWSSGSLLLLCAGHIVMISLISLLLHCTAL